MLLGRNADANQQFCCARVRGVAAELGIFVLELGCAHVGVFARVGIGVNCIALLRGLPHFGVSHQDDIDYAHIFVGKLVLPQLAHALTLVDDDISSARLEIAAEDFHERGFAAAVGADKAVAVALTELDRDVFEQGLADELHSDA